MDSSPSRRCRALEGAHASPNEEDAKHRGEVHRVRGHVEHLPQAQVGKREFRCEIFLPRLLVIKSFWAEINCAIAPAKDDSDCDKSVRLISPFSNLF